MEKEVYRICNNTAVALRAYESHIRADVLEFEGVQKYLGEEK